MLAQVPQLIVAGLTVGSGYALVALGIHIILRATRVINFAQGEFVILGGLLAYTFVNALHLNVWLALAGATVAGFLVGLVYERAVLRPGARVGELAVTIATIGTVYLLLYGHALIWGSLPEPLPFFSGGDSDRHFAVAGFEVAAQQLWVLGLLALALLVLYLFFERTTFGKSIRAAADNPLGARLVGIDVDRARALSVGIAIALAAFGGTIIGPITLVGGAAGVAIAIKGFVGAIVGGLDSPIGCALGGLLVGVVEKLLEGRFSYGVADPIVYSLLLAMLLVRPQGLFGSRAAVRD
ncbi:MAG: branched-chain amino acid ABC transporter permease [Candidatus Eremiobacteraeota bacterium]|nr:branched-chain amino acid ABC transporter permease [Candidatus Eremiobacteraeota bacterium]